MRTAKLHPAAHDPDQVGDDFRLENTAVIGFQAVEDLAADRHDGLELGITALLDRAHSRIALDDVEFAAGGVLGAAIDKLLHPVGQIHLLGDVFLDRDAGLLGVFAALLVDEHLFAGFFGFVRVFDEIDLKLMLEEIGHGLGHKLVGNRLFGLVFVACAGRKAR